MAKIISLRGLKNLIEKVSFGGLGAKFAPLSLRFALMDTAPPPVSDKPKPKKQSMLGSSFSAAGKEEAGAQAVAALTKLGDGFKSGEIKPATSEILGPPQEAIRAKKRRRAQRLEVPLGLWAWG